MSSIQARKTILEALKLQNGLTSGEIIDFALQDNPNVDKQIFYNQLSYMVGKGDLNKDGKRYVLVNREAYANGKKAGLAGTIRPLSETKPPPPQLAGYQQSRKSRQVMIIASPQYFDDIVRVELVHAGGSFTIPLFGAITICTGPDIPTLAPEQESYRGIRCIRLSLRNGRVETLNTNEAGHVTIAPTQS